MNQVSPEKKDSIMKTLAVVGFVGVIILGVWLAVQVVQLIPGAFSSLASLADSLYNNQTETTFTVVNSENILNNNEAFTVTWTEVEREGVYSFMYACTEGVAVDVRDQAGDVIAVACDTPLQLGSTVTSLEVIATSERRRFADVDYTITFSESAGAEALYIADSAFTVINPSIPQSVDIALEDEEEEIDVDVEVDAEEEASKPATTPAEPKPTTIKTPIYALPVSDPRGFVDLAVQFSGVGVMDKDDNFIRTATIDEDTRGAFQFTVINLGTKTSDEWEFEATLTSGQEFESAEQPPLRPNERAVITLGFDAVGESGFQDFGAEVSAEDDVNPRNNQFTWAVRVTNGSNSSDSGRYTEL